MFEPTAVLALQADRVAPRTSSDAPDGSAVAAWSPDERTRDRLRLLNLLWDEQAVRSTAEACEPEVPAGV